MSGWPVELTLAELGWRQQFATAFAPLAAEGLVAARVAIEHRSLYILYTDRAELEATVAGRLRHAATDGTDRPAVGDWVAVARPSGDGRATIRAILPRASVFVRTEAGRSGGRQVVAANIDLVFLLTAIGHDLNPRRVERYLALAWESGAQPIVVISKTDLDTDAAASAQQIAGVALGADVIRLSSLTGEGIDDIRRRVAPGSTAALLGSSGVGKSTLINALLGVDRQRVAAVRDDGKGRHTTTHRELVPLPSGGLLLDTPGMRELQLSRADSGVAAAFEDIEALACRCRFADCMHSSEPGCAVLEAIERGTLDHARLQNWRKLRAELRYLEERDDLTARLERKREGRLGAKVLRSLTRSRPDSKHD